MSVKLAEHTTNAVDEAAANRLTGRRSGFVLTVVVPCFNEEAVICSTYQRVSEVLGSGNFGLRIIFVNDGSVDATARILGEIAASDGRVRVLTFSRNFGHQAAVSAGLALSDGDATVVIDADLQDPPQVVLQMLELWADGYDVVYGVRTKRKEAYWKRLGYSVFYRLFRRLASIDAPLDAGDFSLIDRSVLAQVNRLPEKNRFFRGLRAWVGFRQTGIEYERDPRHAGSTKYSFFKLLKLATDGIFNFSTVPLSLVFGMGVGISLISVVILLAVFILRVTNIPVFGVRVSDVQGFSSLIITILFIGGVQLIGMGIVGEYIGRIYQEVKARPTFIPADHVAGRAAGGSEEISSGQPAMTHPVHGFEGKAP